MSTIPCEASDLPCRFGVKYLCIERDGQLYQPENSKCASKVCLPTFDEAGKPTTKLHCAPPEQALIFQIGSKTAASMIRDGTLSPDAFDDKLNFDS